MWVVITECCSSPFFSNNLKKSNGAIRGLENGFIFHMYTLKFPLNFDYGIMLINIDITYCYRCGLCCYFVVELHSWMCSKYVTMEVQSKINRTKNLCMKPPDNPPKVGVQIWISSISKCFIFENYLTNKNVVMCLTFFCFLCKMEWNHSSLNGMIDWKELKLESLHVVELLWNSTIC